MKVEVRQVDGLTLLAKGKSGHWMILDGSKEFGGSEAAAKPMELFLISLAGCTGMDVISLLNKMRVEFQDLRVNVEAERKDEHPRVFTSIKLEYIVYGDNIDEEKLKKAINKSQEKYCAASAMLKKCVPITHTYKVIQRINSH